VPFSTNLTAGNEAEFCDEVWNSNREEEIGMDIDYLEILSNRSVTW
jgi:hypothetical protein